MCSHTGSAADLRAEQDAWVPSATQIEGKYEILEKLHEGGMGAIYKVRHLLLGGIRVVKVIRPQLGDGAEFKERFLREAKIAFRLPHRNIAQLFDFSVDEQGNAYIVMEFIDGVNLEEVIERPGAAGLPLALEITHQALSALAVLHRKGFIHRDISPDNLMLTRDEEHRPLVKLIDLGIAKELGSESNLTRAGAFVGKLKYCPPERLKSEGDAAVDARSDLYAFGIVLYELLTGSHPIQGRDTASIVGGQLFRDPVPFSDSDPEGRVPEEVRAIVLRSLEKRPEDRFQSAREFREALEPFRQQYPVSQRDLDHALSSAPPTVRIQVQKQKPGSTQNRLDAQFGAGATTPSGRTPSHQQTASSAPPAAQEADDSVPSSTMVAPLPGAKRRVAAQTPPPLPGDEGAAADRTTAEPQGATVADVRGLNRQQQQLVDDIRQAMAEGDTSSARKNLEILRAIAPDSSEVAELDTALASPATSDEELLSGAVDAIEQALERWNLPEAERLLSEARAQHPQADWSELETRIEEIRRGEAISSTAARVNQLIAEGQLDAAAKALADASAEHGEVELFHLAQLRLDEARRDAEAAVGEAVESAHQLIGQGELDAAAAAIAELTQSYGQRQDIADLSATLEAARARAELAAELEAAQQALDAEDPATAMIRLDRALALDDGSTEALQLKEAAQKKIAETEQEQRTADIQGRVEAIRSALATGELTTAEEQLASGKVSYPDEPVWRQLTAELTAARDQHARQEQLDALLTEAAHLLDQGNAEGALERANQALELAPDDPKARTLRDTATSALATAQEQAGAAERQRQLETAADQIRSALAAGDLDTARDRLTSAEEAFGTDPALTELHERIEGAREAAEESERRAEEERRQAEVAKRRQRQIAEVVSSVQASLAADDPDRAAAQLEDAAAVLGEFTEATELRQQVAQAQQRQKDAAIVQATTRAFEEALARGDLAEAEQHLDAARRNLAEPQPLEDLRGRLEHTKQQRAEQHAQAAAEARDLIARGELDRAATVIEELGDAAQAADVQRELSEHRERAERAAKVRTLTEQAGEHRTEGRLDDAARRLEEALELDAADQQARSLLTEVREEIAERQRAHGRAEAAKRIESLLASGKASKAAKLLDKTVTRWGDGAELTAVRQDLHAARTAPERDETAAPSEVSARPKWLIPALAAAVLLCVVAAIWWISGRGEGTQSPPVSGSGQVIVDATPWGEVVEIAAEDGRLVELPTDRFTPLSLSLEAGRYTITVRNPAYDAPVETSVEVAADGTARSLAEFPADVDGLLERLGL